MSDFIPVNEPLFNGNEKKYLNQCIDSGWISSEGDFVKKFENTFATRMKRKHAIAVTNGTAAIDVAIESLEIRPNDEIIVPTFTIISCILQIIRIGAVPVLVDSDPLTWNMDILKIEEKITSKTKAIMAVHIYGLPVDMNPILELCSKYNLKLIEDAAEVIGQEYMGEPCGSFGDVSTFSFYSNKHITTGEGGMVLTDNDNIAEQCRELRNLCFDNKKRFVHKRLGWNLRMTSLQAAVGLAQLEQLNQFIEKKRWIGKIYNDLLNDTEHLELPLECTEYSSNIYWVYGVVLKRTLNFRASDVIDKLLDFKVGSRPFFFPIHQQPVLAQRNLYLNETYPVAENLSQRGLYLPSGLAITEQQIVRVVDSLNKVIHK